MTAVEVLQFLSSSKYIIIPRDAQIPLNENVHSRWSDALHLLTCLVLF